MPAAIVTGSDSGIGKATAVALARTGWDVGITWHRDEAGAHRTAAEVAGHGRRAEVAHLDLVEVPAAADVVDALGDALGGVDALVNSAGTLRTASFLDLPWDEWRRQLTVDLDGAFACSQRAAQRMLEQGRGGRIVNVTSVYEQVPLRGASAYCAAKAGLALLTKVMALELAEHRITVNSVAPGEVATPMTGQEDVDPRTQSRPGIPAGRPGDAREIAATIAFLCSPAAAYVTGASWLVDGGMRLMGPQLDLAR